MEKVYISIDLKSFYASVECRDRGLNSLTTDLVVADPSRGKGALCLAVSPSLKEKGVRNRCRLFEIPRTLRYIIAPPRMRRYMEVSADIYGIYLSFFEKDDIYPYSIDECFIDATSYLSLYKKSGVEIAKMLMEKVWEMTGIAATAGVGTNLFLAKIGMDLFAKHTKEKIAYLDEEIFKEKVWHYRPITDIWNIGNGIARRLAKYGVYDLYGITKLPESLWYKEFGVNAEFLIDHAQGKESCTIADIKAYKPKSHSISTSQVLFEDYIYENARVIVFEMGEVLIQELIEKRLMCKGISLFVGYSEGYERRNERGTQGSAKFLEFTDTPSEIWDAFDRLFKKKVNPLLPIRRIALSLQDTLPIDEVRYASSLFQDFEKEEKERLIQKLMIQVKAKFGRNALLRGVDLLPKATQRMRNQLVGGHHE